MIAGIIISLTLLRRGGSDGDDAIGPEETLESFCRAVAGGDFCKARNLCDTVSMKEYLDTYTEAWETLKRQDSTALAIASAILSETVITTEKIEKNEGCREIYYIMETDGHTKKMKATVGKEDGVWKVQGITDR